jgi:HD-GYP domain-containing protein (c-di-GMP phosphodiesterase class II)
VEAAHLHDIGKQLVDEAVLCKPGRLDANERRQIEMHVVFGASTLLSSGTQYRLAAQVALLHHEWWNGMGYPFRLAAEAIPLVARITAVADVFDALSEERCYKPAWPRHDVMAYVAAQRGRQFDPRCADAMHEVATELPADWHWQALASSFSHGLATPSVPTALQGDPMARDTHLRRIV